MEPNQNLNPFPPEYMLPPFDPIIEFKDGTTLNASAGYNEIDDDLWIWTTDAMSFADAVELFSNNPEKTDKIIIKHSYTETETLEHYTRLMNINEGTAGKKTIRLKR